MQVEYCIVALMGISVSTFGLELLVYILPYYEYKLEVYCYYLEAHNDYFPRLSFTSQFSWLFNSSHRFVRQTQYRSSSSLILLVLISVVAVMK